MKKLISKSNIAVFAMVGMFFTDIPKADAAQCVFVRETENPLFAIYNCVGIEITVMKGAEIGG